MAQIPQCHPNREHQAKGLCKNCYLTYLVHRNPELGKRRNEYSRIYRLKRLEYYRDKALQRNFGISSAQYTRLLESQHGCCAICKKKPKVGRALCVDHDHQNEAVRGLICDVCNRLLGRIEADPARFASVARYLASYRKQSQGRSTCRKVKV
jgi:hypothetical protein